jgi:hypothetical protein
MSSLEQIETWLEALSFISVMISLYLWHRAAKIPSLPYQPLLLLSWQSRLHARAGFAAAAAALFLIFLMAAEVIEAVFGK